MQKDCRQLGITSKQLESNCRVFSNSKSKRSRNNNSRDQTSKN